MQVNETGGKGKEGPEMQSRSGKTPRLAMQTGQSPMQVAEHSDRRHFLGSMDAA